MFSTNRPVTLLEYKLTLDPLCFRMTCWPKQPA